MKPFFRVLFVCLFFLSACATATPTASNAITLRTPSSGYPAANEPNAAVTGGYPAPVQEIILPTPMKDSPDPTKGMVKGILQVKGQPVVSSNLYLAEVIPNAQATEVAARMERATSPRAQTDLQGKFTFVNVPVGRYSLMYDAPPNAYLLLDLKTHLAISVTVKANNTIDLGTLNYDELPN
jgi:hypothetical protein